MRTLLVALGALVAVIFPAIPASAQTSWDPNALPYDGPSSWQRAAVATLNRHLPTDSGFFVLGPVDRAANLPDTLHLVESTLRILAPTPRASSTIARRLRFPTGGVALEEIQPADTLPHELPPGYPGRFLEGTIVGEPVYVQVMTVQEHRWMLWAERAQMLAVTERVGGPLARYSQAVTAYLAAVDSGLPNPQAPQANRFGLDPLFDLYAQPPEPVVRDREGYERLLDGNRGFTLDDWVRDVTGFVPGERLEEHLREDAPSVLFTNKDGELALQRRYRDYLATGGRWTRMPVLSAESFQRLRPGRYLYVVDRYGFMRVGPATEGGDRAAALTTALLAHGEPVRVAGELQVEPSADRSLAVSRIDIESEDYFFSNRSLTLYSDVEDRSDRYVRALGHALAALEAARIPYSGIILQKF